MPEKVSSESKSPTELVVVPADGQLVAEHFARAPTYVLAEITPGKTGNKVGRVTIIPNPGRPPGGLAGFLAELGATGVIAWRIGQQSADRLAERSIWLQTGRQGLIEQVLKTFAAH